MNWSDGIADKLEVAGWDQVEHDDLLDLVRDIAHGTERRYGPLTAYLIGIRVGAELGVDADAGDRRGLVQELIDAARATLDEPAV